MEGGRGPRPDVIRTKEDLYGPVPPFVIWIVSERTSYPWERITMMGIEKMIRVWPGELGVYSREQS